MRLLALTSSLVAEVTVKVHSRVPDTLFRKTDGKGVAIYLSYYLLILGIIFIHVMEEDHN